MRSCLSRRCWLSLLNPSRCVLITRWPPRIGIALFAPADNTRRFISNSQANTARSYRGTVSGRLPNGPEAWVALLDRSLPQHLRKHSETPSQHGKGADNIAEIVLTAQRLAGSGDGVDLLYHLGVEQDRWRAVVWLVKYLVETIALPRSKSSRKTSILNLWTSQDSLHDITYDRLRTQNRLRPGSTTALSQTFDELTGGYHPEDIREEAVSGHEVLGSLWRSLGLMAITCADSEMRPEVLEIIAYLHHTEIMPASIYSQTHAVDVTAIQQPPMLRLFSSAILTSLSDAAWRAHEKTVAEEARARLGQDLTSQLAIPGSAVRMTSPGLRPEVWIELILWSCLHGGWILEGAALVRAISESKGPRWRPLSWSSMSDRPEDWDKLSYLFNSRHAKKREFTEHSVVSVRRTVSSEVVNAYVDALLTTVRSGRGKRGAAPSLVLEYLSTLRSFLERTGLGLQNGSWDAIVLRFFDSQESVIDQGKNFETLMNLSPGLGEGINASNQDRIPQYVLDGTAAILGLFHRALRSRIARGDAQGALRLFECLQDLADQNKHRSLVDFFQRSKLLAGPETQTSSEMFTSNFPGIEYPAFKVQIPPTVLGPFMELLTDAKAYDWGKWLLYNDDGFDEPILPEHLYHHPAVAPALVRFAAETRDSALLEKAIQARATTIRENDTPRLSGNVLQSFVESQVNLGNWRAVERVLRHDEGLQAHSVNTVTIAHLIRIMLLHVPRNDAANSSSADLIGARSLLSNIVEGKYDGNKIVDSSAQDRVTLLLALLASIDRQWAEYCIGLRPLGGAYSFTVTSKEFNLILEGVVHAYGSVAGRNLLDTCWRAGARSVRSYGRRSSRHKPGQQVLDPLDPDLLRGAGRKRSLITIPGQPDMKVVFYGGLQPNVMTMRIILRQAIEEQKESEERSGSPSALLAMKESPSNTIVWAAEALNALQETDALQSAKADIQTGLSKSQLNEILHRLPDSPPTARKDRENIEQEADGDRVQRV